MTENDLSTNIEDRIVYAGFSKELKAAMKAAAKRNQWNRETWRLQTRMIQDAINNDPHPATLEIITRAYQSPSLEAES